MIYADLYSEKNDKKVFLFVFKIVLNYLQKLDLLIKKSTRNAD